MGTGSAAFEAGDSYVDVAVSYSGFSSAPVLTATCRHASSILFTPKIYSIGSNSAVIRVHRDITTSANTAVLNWIAILNQ